MAGQTIIVSVLADTKKFSRDMKSVGDSLKGVGRQFEGVGRGVQNVGGKLTKWITAPALGAAAAVGGVVASFGWGRLKAVDSAQAQLRGLGYSAQDVERITGQLSEALEDGMMTMAEATFAAAGAMAAGVEEGKELTRYIRILDSAVVGGTGTFQEMNQIFARVTDQGKLTRNEFDMIAQRMPGFSSAVQEHMGVSSEAMYEMLRNGEITTEDFLDIMEGFAGDMASEYANTWEGLVANTKAWVGILGETLLGGVFEESKDSLAEFQEYLKSDEVQEWAQKAGEAIGDAFSKIVDSIKEAIQWWQDLDEKQKNFIVTAGAIAVALGPMLSTLGTALVIIGKVSQALGGLRVALAALATPLTLKIALVAAVVGALTWFFTQTEIGQGIVTTVWNKIKEVTETVITWFKDDALPVLQDAWDGIVQAAKDALAWYQEHVEPVFVAIGELFVAIWEEVIKPAIDDFLAGWEAFWTQVQEVWEEYGEPIKETIEVAFENMKDAIQTTWENIKTVIETILGVIKNIIDAITAAIRGDWEGAWNSIRQAASVAWEGIKSIVTNSIESVRRQIDRIMGLIRSLWDRAWNRIRTAVTNAWNGIRTGVSNGINRVLNLIRSLPGRILSALGNLGSLLLNAGRNVINGFINGITAGFRRVRDKLSELTNLLPSWKGPAKKDKTLLKGAGQLVIEGFIDGLESQYGKVKRSLTDLTGMVSDTDAGTIGVPRFSRGYSATPMYAGHGAAAQGGVNINVYALADGPEVGRRVEKALQAWQRTNGAR